MVNKVAHTKEQELQNAKAKLILNRKSEKGLVIREPFRRGTRRLSKMTGVSCVLLGC